MGAEQSHQQGQVGTGREALEQRNYDGNNDSYNIENRIITQSGMNQIDSRLINDERPTSPPMSVCSDSDLPYISYTDRPIGDSPKLRNKNQMNSRNIRSNSMAASARNKQSTTARAKQRPSSSAHNIVVVKTAAKEPNLEMDIDYVKIQSIPMFLPVMRNTLSTPTSRDRDILDRLQPGNLQNICSRMQSHYNVCASQVTNEQGNIMGQIKEIDYKVAKLFSNYVELQKSYAAHADAFSKIRMISQQLSRCNTLLNQNIESLEELNNCLDVEDRMEPFVWKTTNFY